VTRRLEIGFRHRFRDLLALVRPRRLDFGVDLLLSRAQERSVREGTPLARALVDLYLFTRMRVARRLVVTGACSLGAAPWDRFKADPPDFLCDGSLAGLARWLRAAGYDARDAGSLRGDALLHDAARRRLVLATSVADLLDRRLVRDGSVVVQWVPTGLQPTEQLALVLDHRLRGDGDDVRLIDLHGVFLRCDEDFSAAAARGLANGFDVGGSVR